MSYETVENGFRQAGPTRNNSPFLNDLDTVTKFTFAIAAGAANIAIVTITPTNAVATADTTCQPFNLWLSDSAVGANLTGTTASGTVAGTTGYDLVDLVAKKLKMVQPTALGTYAVSITDTAKTGFYVALQCMYTGQVYVSRQLVTADYG